MKQSKNIISFFEHIIQDSRMSPSHISMYVSFFQLWSINHFQNPFRIYREDVMKLSKIRSFATYHKCIKELENAGFIVYLPSYDVYKGSHIEIVDFENLEKNISKLSQNKIPLIEEIPFSVPTFFDVEIYFADRDFVSTEANDFYEFYRSRQWKLSNEKSMKCWQAAARNWILNKKN